MDAETGFMGGRALQRQARGPYPGHSWGPEREFTVMTRTERRLLTEQPLSIRSPFAPWNLYRTGKLRSSLRHTVVMDALAMQHRSRMPYESRSLMSRGTALPLEQTISKLARRFFPFCQLERAAVVLGRIKHTHWQQVIVT